MVFLLAFLGGVLTIVSPCILPVLPFVFTRSGQPFVRSGLPMLVGMAVTFAAVASPAAVAGGWAVRANQYGRWIALAMVGLFGLALIWPGIGARLFRPAVRLGDRLRASEGAEGSPGSSVVLGVATGFLWVPCAGPILGLILAGAALEGPGARTSLLLLTFAAGAAVALAVVLVFGGRAITPLRGSLGSERLRRVLGVGVVTAAVAIAFGWDTGFLTRVSLASTTRMEDGLYSALMPDDTGPGMMAGPGMMSADGGTPVFEGPMPSIEGATSWLNSEPLSNEDLEGKVVLVDFWTYSCINCLRTLPYVKAWEEKYREQGLVVIGVHSPEFAFEKDLGNVGRAVNQLGIGYPVAIDNDFTIWGAFANRFWPAHFFIDANGEIRYRRFGEGGYDTSERVIQELLVEAGAIGMEGLVSVDGEGVALPSDFRQVLSPETYIGYERAENFTSPGGQLRDAARDYSPPDNLSLNQWSLKGRWTIGHESALLEGSSGRIAFRFQARDVNLVLGGGGGPIRFRVFLDGVPAGADGGLDVDADGYGVLAEDRLYQLVRVSGVITDRHFEIEFMDPGAIAYAFTFG